MVVIDTMVFAYALLGVPQFRDESLKVLHHAGEILVPDSFRAELLNVVWQWVQNKAVPLALAVDVLDDAQAIVSHVVPTDAVWERALVLAVQAGHSPYDTLFIALAELNDTAVVTYDQTLLRRFSALSLSPAQFLSSGH